MTFSYLVYYHLFTNLSCLYFPLLPLVLKLYLFESLNFHHEVESLLLLDPLLLQLLVLSELFIPNGYDAWEHDFLIHILDVVVLLVQLLLSFRQHTLGPLDLLQRGFRVRLVLQPSLPLLILHFLLLYFGCCLGQLLLKEGLLALFFSLSTIDSLFNSLELTWWYDSSILLFSQQCFFLEWFKLFKSYHGRSFSSPRRLIAYNGVIRIELLTK